MKTQFIVINATRNLGDIAPIGTKLFISHNTKSQFDEKNLRAYLSTNGHELGNVASSVYTQDAFTSDELFDVLKKKRTLERFDCIVTGHETISLGNNKLERIALIIEPVMPITIEKPSLPEQVQYNAFTVVNPGNDLTKKFPIGEFVIARHDETNAYDKKAILTYEANGKRIGYVAQHLSARETAPNTDLYDVMEKQGKLKGMVCKVIRHDLVLTGNQNRLECGVLVIEPA